MVYCQILTRTAFDTPVMVSGKYLIPTMFADFLLINNNTLNVYNFFFYRTKTVSHLFLPIPAARFNDGWERHRSFACPNSGAIRRLAMSIYSCFNSNAVNHRLPFNATYGVVPAPQNGSCTTHGTGSLPQAH